MSSNLITVKLGLHLEKFTLLVCGELVEYVRKLRWGLGDATSDVNDDDIDYGEGKDNGDDEADQEDDHNDVHDEIMCFSTTCDNHV